MIFVTVGSQMPFDRLVKTVDRWAGERGRSDVFVQVGQSTLRPAHAAWAQFLDPAEFKRRFAAARVIVSHAGTGSIIMALQLGKPIVIMPRRASLRETRNDHQVATAEQFGRIDSVAVAWDESTLIEVLDGVDKLRGRQALGPHASPELLREIRRFIDGESYFDSRGSEVTGSAQKFGNIDDIVSGEGRGRI